MISGGLRGRHAHTHTLGLQSPVASVARRNTRVKQSVELWTRRHHVDERYSTLTKLLIELPHCPLHYLLFIFPRSENKPFPVQTSLPYKVFPTAASKCSPACFRTRQRAQSSGCQQSVSKCRGTKVRLVKISPSQKVGKPQSVRFLWTSRCVQRTAVLRFSLAVYSPGLLATHLAICQTRIAVQVRAVTLPWRRIAIRSRCLQSSFSFLLSCVFKK